MITDQIVDFINTLKINGKLLIVIKGSPDPDALASSFALKIICSIKGIQSDIISITNISLPQNRLMIQKLDIPVHFMKEVNNIKDYAGYAIMDYPSSWIEEIGSEIPCLIHLDHHTQKKDIIEPAFRFVTNEVGAVSTIFALILKNASFHVDSATLVRIATALNYGIKTDTDSYEHVSPADTEAIDWLERYTDKKIIAEIESTPYSEETMTIISKALMNACYYKDCVFSGVGFISDEYRDSIAITADYLLDNENVLLVVVFALIEDKKNSRLILDASVRTSLKTFDLNKFIRLITPEGGARTYKGAFQINLNFFKTVPDKHQFWNLVRDTAIERLKNGRDHFLPMSIEGMFEKIKRKIGRLFRKSDS